MNSEAWYAAWMAKANQMGIMTGASGKMNPGSEVTLAEVAAMLVRALGLPVDKDATVDGVAAWAAPYVKALLDAGLIDDAADAGKPMTRGAFAEVIFRVSGGGNYAKEENAEITEDVNGSIVITANGVSLKGITVKGDIIIADGVDAGSVVLDGVKVEGRIVVRGAGAELTNGTTAGATVVAATTGETTVKADASSSTGDIAVAGTNGMAADKVVLDMAEPNATVTAATEVAVQNAKGGEITLQAPNASLSVESGTVANVTVADGASGVKVDVAAGATIDKVTTNTDLAVTGEGTVSEKAGSGTVTDGSGNEVAGSDEPVEVPTVEEPAPEVDPNAPTNPTHIHDYTGGTVAKFDATRHTIQCVGTPAVGTNGQPGYVAAVPCSAVIYEAHDFSVACQSNGTVATGDGADAKNVYLKCSKCEQVQPKVTEGEVEDPDDAEEGFKACGAEGAEHAAHSWVALTGEAATTAGDGPATCEADGQTTYECEYCHSTRADTLPATGHSLTPYKTVAPTCNENGGTYFKCSNGCEKYNGTTNEKSVIKAIPATNQHVWNSGTVTTPATCMKAGVKTYTCTSCTKNNGAAPADSPVTKTAEIAINPTAHTWAEVGTADESHTTHTLHCTNTDGAQSNPRTCAVTKKEACTFTATATGDNVDAEAATCEGTGKTVTKKCAKCDNTHFDVIPALGHDVVWVTTPTTHKKICSRSATCGAAAEVAEVAHTWSDKTASNPGGAKDAVCTVCGYKSTGAAAHVHIKASEWTKDADQHWHACTGTGTCPDNNKRDAANHSWANGAEDTAGACSVCTYTCQKDHANCTTEETKCACGFINAES